MIIDYNIKLMYIQLFFIHQLQNKTKSFEF